MGAGESKSGEWNGGTKDNASALSQEKIQSYAAELQRLKEVTGLSEVDDIVTRFLEAEEQNFSLFNYVNGINSEVERLEHSISEVKVQIEKFRGQGMSTDTQRKKAVRDLEQKLERTERRIEEYDSRAARSRKQIQHFKNSINSILARIGAGASAGHDELLGNLTESNMLQYLGIIEQKTTEVLHAYAATQLSITPLNDAGVKDLHLTVVQPKGPVFDDILREYEEMLRESSGGAVSDVAPQPAGAGTIATKDDLRTDDSNSEDDERPLTRQELDKKSQREFSRRVGESSK